MKAMDILRACRQAEADLRRLRAIRTRYQECATSITRALGGAAQGTSEIDRMAAYAADIDGVDQQINRRLRLMAAEQQAALRIIEALPEQEGDVLYHFYVTASPVKLVASALGLTDSYVCKLRKKGASLAAALPEKQVEGWLPDWYQRERKEPTYAGNFENRAAGDQPNGNAGH